MFTDSHCHLSFPELQAQLPSILAAMAQAKVDRALCICTTLEEFEDVYGLARDNANLWCTVGVHPDNEGVQEPSLDDLLTRAARPRVVGIGETGLDYYRLGERTVSDMEWQRERYLTHIRAGRQMDLPLVIHTRSASEDTLVILRESGGFQSSGETASTQARSRGVFHCFTETAEVARAALDMDFYISFSGIITFRNAAELREVVRFVPMERMLIETDSPYLAPIPMRGKKNEPSYIKFTAEKLAFIKKLNFKELDKITTNNFNFLFNN